MLHERQELHRKYIGNVDLRRLVKLPYLFQNVNEICIIVTGNFVCFNFRLKFLTCFTKYITLRIGKMKKKREINAF